MADESSRNHSLWRNTSFLLMWTSVAASGFGDRLIQLAAEPLLGVYDEGASAAKIQAGIMFFFLLPYMLLTVVGGWMADRLPRKWIMLCCDEGRAVVLLVAYFMAANLGAAQAIDSTQRWKVYMILALAGAFAAIFSPAKQSIMPQIIRTSHLQQANAVLAGIALIASLIGLQAGGPIIENISVQAGIFLGVLSYGISGLFFAFLKTHPNTHSTLVAKKRTGLFSQVAQAAGYMRTHRTVRTLVGMNILFWMAAWFVNSAVAALNKLQYDLPTDRYLTAKGTMMAMLGLGMLGASLFLIWYRTRRESSTLAMTALPGAGLLMILLAINHSYAMGLAMVFGIGIFGGIFLISVDTLTQSLTPNHLRGRIFGTRALLNTISGVVVNLIVWQLPASKADRFMIWSLLITGGILLIIALRGWWVQTTRGPMPTRTLNVIWRFNRIFCLVWHRLTIVNQHHIPNNGPMILASNHTAGIDPFIMQVPIQKLIKWVMLRNYRFPLLESVWKQMDPITLDLAGSDISQIRAILKALKQDCTVGLFPEGRLQRDVRELQEFRPGIGMIARRTGAIIVPVWIHGTPATKNMLWHFLLPSRSTVIYGNPYKPDPNMTNEEIVHDLRDRLIALAKTVNP